MIDRRRLLQFGMVGGVAVLAAGSGAHAQAAWPNRPVKIIVTFPPGGERSPGPDSACGWSMLYKDGIHWCLETVGPRILGGVACLLRCSGVAAAGDCHRACNERYMRLRPLTS